MVCSKASSAPANDRRRTQTIFDEHGLHFSQEEHDKQKVEHVFAIICYTGRNEISVQQKPTTPWSMKIEKSHSFSDALLLFERKR